MSITEHKVQSILRKINLMSNKLYVVNRYKNNAEIASDRSRDRPMSPDELVVYWTEYAIRHRGAPHFKSHAFSLTWYEYLQLDVIVAILVCVLLALFYIYKVFKIVTDFFAYDSSHNKVK